MGPRDQIHRQEVIDGQQRLTTLKEFYDNKLTLVENDDAAYLSPNSLHYAGKKFDELPTAYQQAFKRFNLTLMILPELGDTRLEIFRRINQGGTPLSGHDIRLAYYGEDSPSVTFIRLAGIYDMERDASKRFVKSAKEKHDLEYPWQSKSAIETWKDWWDGKEKAKGQEASESFLISLVAKDVDKLSSLLKNEPALRDLHVRYSGALDEALDAYCAHLRYQDIHKAGKTKIPPILTTLEELQTQFFPAYERWFQIIAGEKAASLSVTKHRLVSIVIGCLYSLSADPKKLTEKQWMYITDFLHNPVNTARMLAEKYLQSRGRWPGNTGHEEQIKSAHRFLAKALKADPETRETRAR